MASTAARLFFKSSRTAPQLIRGQSKNLGDTAQNVRLIRFLLLSEQKSITQLPVFSESFPVLQNGFRSSVLAEEKGIRFMVTDRSGEMEAARGTRVISDDSDEDGDEDFDGEDVEDFDEDDFDDDDDDFDDGDSDEDEDYARKKK